MHSTGIAVFPEASVRVGFSGRIPAKPSRLFVFPRRLPPCWCGPRRPAVSVWSGMEFPGQILEIFGFSLAL